MISSYFRNTPNTSHAFSHFGQEENALFEQWSKDWMSVKELIVYNRPTSLY
jgi:hypothetical protein